MNRIMIIGCCGAGKSTLAKKLEAKLELPLIHLDQHYHLPGWTEPSAEAWNQKVEELASGDQWIIDGNFSSSMDTRLAKADAIIYLKYSTLSCLARIMRRTWKYHGTVRPDMAEGCPERFDLEFFHYVATFNLKRGKRILNRVKSFQGKKYVFMNDREVNRFLDSI